MEYGVSQEQLKRDIKYLRDIFEDEDAGFNNTIEYNRKDNQYELIKGHKFLTYDQVMMILIIIYHTRSLCKNELENLSSKLIKTFSLNEQIKMRSFFNSYQFHYKPIQPTPILNHIQEIFKAIMEKRVLSFVYRNRGESKQRKVIPYTITYQDGFLYVVAKKVDSDNVSPFYWRLDKVSNCSATNERFIVPHGADFFDVGDFVGRSFNMHTGNSQTVRLKVERGTELYLMRESPRVTIIKDDPTETFVMAEVEVFGDDGIMFWILKQQDRVEVLEPLALRNKVKEAIQRMIKVYEE